MGCNAGRNWVSPTLQRKLRSGRGCWGRVSRGRGARQVPAQQLALTAEGISFAWSVPCPGCLGHTTAPTDVKWTGLGGDSLITGPHSPLGREGSCCLPLPQAGWPRYILFCAAAGGSDHSEQEAAFLQGQGRQPPHTRHPQGLTSNREGGSRSGSSPELQGTHGRSESARVGVSGAAGVLPSLSCRRPAPAPSACWSSWQLLAGPQPPPALSGMPSTTEP